MVQQSTIQKGSKYYRSTHYRSASFDIKQNKLNLNTQRLPVFQIKKPQTTNNQTRRSIKNLFKSQQNLKNFSKSLSQSLSKVKQFELNSTYVSQSNPEEQTIQNFGTCSYLQSFQGLMSNQGTNTYIKKKMGAMSIKLQSLKANHKIDRIALPNVIEHENSQFTALDPIRLPINGIKEQIQKTRKEVEECPTPLKAIRCEMREFKQKNIKQIQFCEADFMKTIKRLWGCLRQNSVYQQSFVMRSKRQIKELQDFIPQFKQQFSKTKIVQLNIQKTIFETAPFELELNEPYKQDLEQDIEMSMPLNFSKSYF